MSDRTTRLHEAEATMRMLQHEVRTPLGHIIGYSEMLEEEMLERNIEDLGDDLAKIRRAATRLLDLVDGKLLTDPTEEIAQSRPLESTAEESTVGADEAPDADGILRGKILVVDADVDARERLMRELRGRGLAVEAAKDGIEALREIAEGNFKLVVLDLLLPGMNGLEVLERIRRSRSMSELPVVLVAALTDPADAIEGLRSSPPTGQPDRWLPSQDSSSSETPSFGNLWVEAYPRTFSSSCPSDRTRQSWAESGAKSLRWWPISARRGAGWSTTHRIRSF